jgi:hypothetical protein
VAQRLTVEGATRSRAATSRSVSNSLTGAMHQIVRHVPNWCQAPNHKYLQAPVQSCTVRGMTADPVAIGWVPIVESFGARLALVRQRMGWGNVKEAAECCGLPVQSWRNWERDSGQPRDIVKAAQRISAVTGVNYYWLLDGNAVPMSAPIAYEGPERRTPRRKGGASADVDECAWRDSNPQPSDP